MRRVGSYNYPCPCGSGKLYGQCCGVKAKVISLDQVRWRRVGQELRRKLGEFADGPFFTREAARAQQIYLDSLDSQLVERDDEFTMERCFEWFIFDYPLPDGSTIIETFRQNPDLSERERVLLVDWASARVSLFEVLQILPGKGVVLRDLFHKTEVKVHDVNAAVEVEPGTILFMRLLKVGEEYEFSTSGLALPGFCKDALFKRLKKDLQAYARKRGISPREGLDQYLKERSHIINAMVLEIGFNYTLSHLVGNERNELSNSLPDSLMDKLSARIARRINDAFLDEYSFLPKEQETEKKLLFKNPDDYQWPGSDHAEIAWGVVEDLRSRGYEPGQVEGALHLWYDYCSRVRPSFRKPAVWVATVVYTMARLEVDQKINQQDLAKQYGVAASTISANFRAMCRALDLVAFDRRYSTKRVPLAGLKEKDPLLAQILKDLKL